MEKRRKGGSEEVKRANGIRRKEEIKRRRKGSIEKTKTQVENERGKEERGRQEYE